MYMYRHVFSIVVTKLSRGKPIVDGYSYRLAGVIRNLNYSEILNDQIDNPARLKGAILKVIRSRVACCLLSSCRGFPEQARTAVVFGGWPAVVERYILGGSQCCG